MTVSHQKWLKVLLDQVDQISDRVPDYREELFETSFQIVLLEMEHSAQATHIQKKVNAKSQELAKVLIEVGWEPDS